MPPLPLSPYSMSVWVDSVGASPEIPRFRSYQRPSKGTLRERYRACLAHLWLVQLRVISEVGGSMSTQYVIDSSRNAIQGSSLANHSNHHGSGYVHGSKPFCPSGPIPQFRIHLLSILRFATSTRPGSLTVIRSIRYEKRVFQSNIASEEHCGPPKQYDGNTSMEIGT